MVWCEFRAEGVGTLGWAELQEPPAVGDVVSWAGVCVRVCRREWLLTPRGNSTVSLARLVLDCERERGGAS
jgi:hypothetical protein